MSSQPLVCPQELSLEPGKRGLLIDYMDQVKKFGFDFDEKLRLTQVPRIDRLVLGNYYISTNLFEYYHFHVGIKLLILHTSRCF